MKCCSRSTLGVIIAIINILVYLIASVFLAAFIGQINDPNNVVHQKISEEHEKATGNLKKLYFIIQTSVL